MNSVSKLLIFTGKSFAKKPDSRINPHLAPYSFFSKLSCILTSKNKYSSSFLRKSIICRILSFSIQQSNFHLLDKLILLHESLPLCFEGEFNNLSTFSKSKYLGFFNFYNIVYIPPKNPFFTL